MTSIAEQAFTGPELKAIEQIQKLLNVAAKAGTPEEAATFAAKAQELMNKFNLDAAVVEKNSGVADGRREDHRVRGGFYQYQRAIWKAVSDLHFCVYWTQEYLEEGNFPKRMSDGTIKRFMRMRKQKRHRLVGKIINTRASVMMSQYLEGAVERLTREYLIEKFTSQGLSKNLYSNFAMSFREGCADMLTDKVAERFRSRLAEAERERRKAAEKAKEEGRPVLTGTALTLLDVQEAEEQSNYDFIHGEGAWARREARQAKYAAERAEEIAEEEAAYTKWCAAHPEEAARRAEEERKREERNAKRRANYSPRGYRNYGGDNTDSHAFYAGRDAAKKIGLDPQAGASVVAGRLR